MKQINLTLTCCKCDCVFSGTMSVDNDVGGGDITTCPDCNEKVPFQVKIVNNRVTVTCYNP